MLEPVTFSADADHGEVIFADFSEYVTSIRDAGTRAKEVAAYALKSVKMPAKSSAFQISRVAVVAQQTAVKQRYETYFTGIAFSERFVTKVATSLVHGLPRGSLALILLVRAYRTKGQWWVTACYSDYTHPVCLWRCNALPAWATHRIRALTYRGSRLGE
jgi:hypothetical protein